MTHLLQFTDPRSGERHYFVSLGDPWQHHPQFRLIKETTRHREQATAFDSLAAALEPWITANRPPGWQVLELDGEAVKQIIEP